jgi:ornithine cyclodeaminase/alanine dehydrogenase-like protein (mu-crystallin family)
VLKPCPLESAVAPPTGVRADTHVTSVGYRESHGELPRKLLERGRLFVESRLAFEPAPTGCYELQGVDPATGTELAEVLRAADRGATRHRRSPSTRRVGHAIEDVVAAELALRMAVHERAGHPEPQTTGLAATPRG